MRRLGLRAIVLAYLVAILLGPLSYIAYRAFGHGLHPFWAALSAGPALHAFKLTLIIAAIAVPANTIFGIVCGIAIVRQRFPGKGLLNALVDLPLALSPVVVGLALFLLYGRQGWLGSWLLRHNIQVLFALPSMVLATIFVSLPFVVREVVPVLREIGIEQEQAAATLGASRWQIFRRITLPSIRWAVAYGVVLTTARSLGEYGAVSIVSGRIENKTQTATLLVQDRWESFDFVGAYTASVLLAAIAIAVLVAMNLFKPKEGTSR
ncbi:MAG: sulfate ABC transporter permease [Gaiellaceae bacterium]